jgi:pseudouridylate synthase
LSAHIAPAVAEAHEHGGAIVALESTLIAHGLPRPRNLEVAGELEAAVRAEGAVPATVAVVAGEVRIGLDAAGLAAIAAGDGVAKCSVRDLGPVMAGGGHGATTVAATAHLAARAGIQVFATGGLGGVHHGGGFDESADLATLAATPIVVVCAGVKSLLDVGATLERLESLSVTVLGYATDAFPGFYLSDSGFPAPGRADSPEEVAAVALAARSVGAPGAIVVANPLPVTEQLDPALHDRVVRSGLEAAAAAGICGRDVTPFLLDRFHRETGGASLGANVRLVLRNAALAARIAVALAR